METTELKEELHALIDQLDDVEVLKALKSLARGETREPTAADYRKAAVLNGNRVLAKSLRKYER